MGMHTVISEGADTIFGGQKQRLSELNIVCLD